MSKPVVAVIAAGAMGAGVAARLTANGVDVITSLTGRSRASIDRAEKAGMRPATEADIANAGIILSILPPRDAVALAERLAPALKASEKKPLYVDCNAVSSATVERIAAIVTPTGAVFADGGIIGPPPKPGSSNTTLFVSGVEGGRLNPLLAGGLQVKLLKGPVGAASALKMSYAAITKGLSGLGTASILAAARYGAADALRDELERSQPATLAFLARSIPDMFSKAYRFVGEMEEIADHAGRASTAEIFHGIAQLFQEIADDGNGARKDIAALEAFFKPAAKP